ncbi:MerR family transcriptional regulator, partial [Lacticaseibacillus rhamnosus]
MTIMEKYYTPEQLESLRQRQQQLGEERIEQAPAEWAELMALVRAEMEMGTPPTDFKVQSLA